MVRYQQPSVAAVVEEFYTRLMLRRPDNRMHSRSAPQSPWQNPYAERLLGSIRRDCLNQAVNHLERVPDTNPGSSLRWQLSSRLRFGQPAD